MAGDIVKLAQEFVSRVQAQQTDKYDSFLDLMTEFSSAGVGRDGIERRKVTLPYPPFFTHLFGTVAIGI